MVGCLFGSSIIHHFVVLEPFWFSCICCFKFTFPSILPVVGLECRVARHVIAMDTSCFQRIRWRKVVRDGVGGIPAVPVPVAKEKRMKRGEEQKSMKLRGKGKRKKKLKTRKKKKSSSIAKEGPYRGHNRKS